MKKKTQQVLAYVFGVVFVIVLIVLAVLFPKPTAFQYMVFRIVLAMSAASVMALIPGFINIKVAPVVGITIRAGGAIAVFVVVYCVNPAALLSHVSDGAEGPQPAIQQQFTKQVISSKDGDDAVQVQAQGNVTASKTEGVSQSVLEAILDTQRKEMVRRDEELRRKDALIQWLENEISVLRKEGKLPDEFVKDLPLQERKILLLKKREETKADAAKYDMQLALLCWKTDDWVLAERAARALLPHNGNLFVLLVLGDALVGQSRIDEAENVYAELVSKADELHDLGMQRLSVRFLAYLQLRGGKLDLCKKNAKRAIQLAKDDTPSLMACLDVLAEAMTQAGQFAEAVIILQDLRALATKTGDSETAVVASLSLVKTHYFNEDIDSAEKVLTELLPAVTALGNDRRTADAYGLKALIERHYGDKEAARAADEKALALYQKAGETAEALIIRSNLAIGKNAYVEALQCTRLHLELSATPRSVFERAGRDLMLAFDLYYAKSYEESIGLTQKVLNCSQQYGFHYMTALAALVQGWAHERQCDLPAAKVSWSIAEQEYRKLGLVYGAAGIENLIFSRIPILESTPRKE
jgi:tetratricopeptide (TPR) repeat protein